jgi:uncharacterized membrane protein
VSSSTSSRLSVYVTTLCAVAYAVVAHIAIARESVALTIGAVALLAATTLAPPLAHGHVGAWLTVPIVAAGCYLLSKVDTPILLLYLPPMLGTLFMAWLFGHTLAQNRTPLIARIIRLMLPPQTEPDPSVWDYARRLTYAWTLLFLALTLLDLALALIVRPDGLLELAGVAWDRPTISPETWSLFANVFQYVIVVAFFVLEYAYRCRRFPDQPYRNMLDFIRRAIAVSPKLLGGGK